MLISKEYTFPRYLAAKKSVDDRALNRQVWETLAAQLPPVDPVKPLRVLEIGAGIGTMIERAFDWGLLQQAEYTALDAQSENITHAGQRLPEWARRQGYTCSKTAPTVWTITHQERQVAIHLQTADFFDFAAQHQDGPAWDLMIAHAFLDLIDVPASLPKLLGLLRPGGLFYFTLNFDGATLFQPEIDPALDVQIEALYHASMDQRLINGVRSGDSRTGRRLFHHLLAHDVDLLAAGASDWVVFPGPDGYHQDEAYFLHFIVHTLHMALQDHLQLPASQFEDWIATRHSQIERQQLVYIAHQIDICGRLHA